MNKLLILCLSAVLSVSLLTACNRNVSNNPNGRVTENTTSTEPVVTLPSIPMTSETHATKPDNHETESATHGTKPTESKDTKPTEHKETHATEGTESHSESGDMARNRITPRN